MDAKYLPLAWFVKPPKIADKAKLVERVHPIATVIFNFYARVKSYLNEAGNKNYCHSVILHS